MCGFGGHQQMKIHKTTKKNSSLRGQAQNRTISLARFGIFSGVTAVLALIVCAALLVQWASNREAELQRRIEHTSLEAYRAAFGAAVGRLVATVERTARSPALLDLISLQDPASRAQGEQGIAALIPGALHVRVFDPDPDLLRADPSGKPALGFAAVDMLRRAADGAPAAEAHGLGTALEHFSIARAIEHGTQRKGLLLVDFSLDELTTIMGDLPATEGYVELQQTAAGATPQMLASTDRAITSGDAPSAAAPVRGSTWRLAYWPTTPPSGLDRLQIPAAIVGVAIALVVIVLWRLQRRVAGILRQDLSTLVKLVRDLIQGREKKSYPVGLTDLHDVVVDLRAIPTKLSKVAPASSDENSPQSAPRSSTDTFPSTAGGSVEAIASDPSPTEIPPGIFREYDIRGVSDETLTAEIIQQIGRALGSEAQLRGLQKIVVGRDARTSSADLCAALARGLRMTGMNVIDLGEVPTPLVYFALNDIADVNSGVVVTGSHNPAEYNGLKIVLDGEALHGEAIQGLLRRAQSGEFQSGTGEMESSEIATDYVMRILSDVHVARPLKVALDCGNGVTGSLAPRLLRQLGCEVIEVFCEVDGTFPNHPPDPTNPDNLSSLIETVREQQAEVGLALDGDGDRLIAVDNTGQIVWPDRLLMLFASDLLARQPGSDVIFDVKCSRHLPRIIAQHGGNPHMWRSGHSVIKARMRETGALLAGEFTGHIVFAERWYGFDDGMYAAVRLLEILGLDPRSSQEVFDEFPVSISTPELSIAVADGEQHRIVEQIIELADYPGARTTTLDGLRVDFEDGWGLVRASNTSPNLLLRFEADDDTSLARVQDEFRTLLHKTDPGLQIPF